MAQSPMGWVAAPVNWNKTFPILLIESTTEQKTHCHFFKIMIYSIGPSYHGVVINPAPTFKNVQNMDIIWRKYFNEFLWQKGHQKL